MTPSPLKSQPRAGVGSKGKSERPLFPIRVSHAALLLAVFTLIAYSNSFRVPFLFDDLAAIPDNPTIRHLSNLSAVFSPPVETTVYGRPILNLSFAVNYALSGLGVWSYHAGNLLVHIAAALCLLGVVRRTLHTPPLVSRFGAAATPLACATALLWSLHPVQTESVTYIVQRAEALAGLWYFLTLYCFLRFAETPARKQWAVLSVLSCALGMGTKEILATAPFVVLLYDRTYLSSSFGRALRRRAYYGALFSTLGIVLFLAAKGRPGSAGFDEGMTSLEYARTQVGVVIHYLRLVIWPSPLVFDYSWPVAAGARVFLPLMLLLPILGATARLLLRNRPAGFPAAGFFMILAPTSSIVPIITEVAAEHRLYLPLACVMALIVPGVYHFLTARTGPQGKARLSPATFFKGAALLALFLAALTFRRNLDYRSPIVLWEDTVQKRPSNVRAQYNLAKALEESGRVQEAVRRYQQDVLRLKPDYADAHANLGLALLGMGRQSEAMQHFAAALKAKPTLPQAHNNMALGLARQGRTEEALRHYAEAIRLKADYAEAYYNMANSLAAAGRPEEAVLRYVEAQRLKPDFGPAYVNLAITLEGLGRHEEAAEQYRSALRIRPDYAKAHLNLGLLLHRKGDKAAARHHLENALRLQPDIPAARQALESISRAH